MSLKEEISQWYFECFQDWKHNGIEYYDKDTAAVLTDGALSKFEKKIDELEQEYTDNAFSDFGKGWNEGYHISLQKIKEMLK